MVHGWLAKTMGQRQLQDETRNIWVLGFGALMVEQAEYSQKPPHMWTLLAVLHLGDDWSYIHTCTVQRWDRHRQRQAENCLRYKSIVRCVLNLTCVVVEQRRGRSKIHSTRNGSNTLFSPSALKPHTLNYFCPAPTWLICLGPLANQPCICRADSRFAPSQWETALLCNDVSHWLGLSLESALYMWKHLWCPAGIWKSARLSYLTASCICERSFNVHITHPYDTINKNLYRQKSIKWVWSRRICLMFFIPF